MKTLVWLNVSDSALASSTSGRLVRESVVWGWKDRDDIIPLLHTLRRPTFFTRDHGFYHPGLLHSAYCLVYLDVAFDEIADFIRRFSRHAAFRTQAQRMGKVVRIHHSSVSYWQVNVKKANALRW